MKPTILTLLLCLTAQGCSDNTACVADDDCFKGEVCVQDVCERPTGENNATNNAPVNNQTAQSNTPNNSPNNQTTSSNNVTVGQNNPTNNNTTPPNNTTATNNTSGPCRGSTFDSCTPDDDASSPTMLSGDFGRGCVMPDDDFEGGTITAAAIICPLEESDRFSVSINPCATAPFFLDVSVTPREVCAPGDFALDVSLNANDCEEGNGLVSCMDGDMGAKTASLVVEPDSSVNVLYIDVLPIADNLCFEYDVSVTFRQ